MSSPSIHVGSLWRRFLIISGIFGAAVAVPVLDLYGKNPEVFVANRSSGWQIVAFGLAVTLVVPAVVVAVLAVTDLAGERISRVVYYSLVVVASVALGLVVSRQITPDNDWAAMAIAAAVTGGVLMLHARMLSTMRHFAWVGPVAFAMFLTLSPTSHLVWGTPAAADGGTAIDDRAPIVFIQLDEFPVASLLDERARPNRALFPNFARLVDSATWYRNALSSSIATTLSVPAALTGRHVDRNASPSAVDHPNNLFTLVGDSYEMHVIEWVTELCPQDTCEDYAGRSPAHITSLLQDVGVVYGHLSLPPFARDALPSIDNSWAGFLGQEDQLKGAPIAIEGLPVPPEGDRAAWIDWLQRIINGIEKDAPPTLHFAHLQAPHTPWQINPSGTHYERPEQYDEVDGVETGGRWVADARFGLLGFQRHLLQLGFLDRALGRLLDALETTETWDDALVVVVADHGASFAPDEHRRWPYERNRDDLYRVPLIIKYPRQEAGMVVDLPAFSIDIVPTIVDALGIDTSWTFDGVSLLRSPSTDRPHEPIAWCCNTTGVSTDLSVLEDQIRRNHDRIPDQSSWLGVVAVGPHRDLVGTNVADLDTRFDARLRWSMANAEALIDADAESGFVQTLISGRVELPADISDTDVLIAVNGVVAGSGFVVMDGAAGGELRGLVAEGLVAEGTNEVALLMRDPEGAWIEGALEDLTVEYVADGRVLDIHPEGNRRIQIDEVSRDFGGWTITGWSADISAKTTPERLHLFVGAQLVASGPPTLDNPNVVRWHKSETLLTSGFQFTLSDAAVPQGATRVTIIAEFGDIAVANPVSLTR